MSRLTVVLSAILLFVRFDAQAAPGKRTLVFLATSDQHGHVEKDAQLGHLFAEERAKNPGRVMLLDGGDMFQGTLVSNLHEGAVMIRAFDALHYDAAAVGNHEFDYGPAGPHTVPKDAGENPRGALQARIREATFPILSCNLVDDKTGQPIFKPWTMLHVDGVNIAVIGGTTEDTPRTTNKRNLTGLRVLPLGATVAKTSLAARAAGATVVVAVVHAGGNCKINSDVSDDKPGDLKSCEDDAELFQLARVVSRDVKLGTGGRIDAIFGGHTHQGVTAIVDGIPLLQAFSNGMAYSKLELEVAADGVPTGHFIAHAPRKVGDDVPRDAAVDKAVAPAIAEVESMRLAPVGIKLATPIDRAYRAESPLGNLVADTIRAATSADIGLTNGGGLRADLPAGELKYGDLFQALPFDNRLATMTITGAAFRDLLTRNFSHDKGILSVSGIKVEAHCAAGKLIIEGTLADGSKLSDDKPYKIGTTDFLANGGDDFGPTVASRAPLFLDTAPIRDVVAEVLKKWGRPLDAAQLVDRAHPRLALPMPKPVVCK
jgi:5'-nucleotidase